MMTIHLIRRLNKELIDNEGFFEDLGTALFLDAVLLVLVGSGITFLIKELTT